MAAANASWRARLSAWRASAAGLDAGEDVGVEVRQGLQEGAALRLQLRNPGVVFIHAAESLEALPGVQQVFILRGDAGQAGGQQVSEVVIGVPIDAALRDRLQAGGGVGDG